MEAISLPYLGCATMFKIGIYNCPSLKLSEYAEIVRKIHDSYRDQVTATELAQVLEVSSRGKGLRSRVEDLQLYHLIEGSRSYKLTELGLRVASNSDDFDALKQAFLSVPLFKAMYDKFGRTLPEDMNAYKLRLKAVTKAPDDKINLLAIRLRNHYTGESSQYLSTPRSGQEEGMRNTGPQVSEPTAGQQMIQIPANLEKIQFGNDLFIFLPKQDPDTLKKVRALLDVYIGETSEPRLDERKTTPTKKTGTLEDQVEK